MLLFMLGLKKVRELAQPAGGLTGYYVADYMYGRMRMDFKVADPEHPVNETIRAFLYKVEKHSRKMCVMCGEDARPSRRFMPHDWAMPLCKVKNRIHSDRYTYRLIEPDFDLSVIYSDLVRRGKIKPGSPPKRSGQQLTSW